MTAKTGGVAVRLRDYRELQPYKNNARIHSAEGIEQLAAIMQDVGYTNPILVDGDLIVGGHKRLKAVTSIYASGGRLRLPDGTELPQDTVPTIDCSGWTEGQRRAYIIADNQTTMDSEWDLDLLKIELDWLKDVEGIDLSLTGFTDASLESALTAFIADDKEQNSKRANYSRKIKVPTYEPSDVAPALGELFNRQKSDELLAEIEASDAPDDVKQFLRFAAERHTEFNYAKVADFYAAADAPIQRLMENSALVIIDFDRAIENGFVKMTKAFTAMTGERFDPEAEDAE